jgi:hypothetical protein
MNACTKEGAKAVLLLLLAEISVFPHATEMEQGIVV